MIVFRRVIGVMLLLSTVAFIGEAQTTNRVNVQSTRQLLRRIEDRVDLLRNSLNRTGNQSSIYRDDNASALLTSFADAVRQLRFGLNRRSDSYASAQTVLDRATPLENIFSRRNTDATTRRYWSNVRTDLNELARTYGLTWNVSDRPGDLGGRYGRTQLTGTYRLDSSQSESPAAAIDRALRSVPYQERQQRRDQLLRRLDPPEQIAIDVKGRSVTLVSTRAQQINFDVDGTERVETTPNGRTIRVRSTLSGDQLSITSTGDRDNQFNVTFVPLENGRRLRVSRQIYATDLTNPVEIQSFYDRTADVAQLDIYAGQQGYPTTNNNNDFLLRSGESVVAELSTPLSTRTSHDGDRFTATIRTPSEYEGATIEGYVSTVKRSGRVTGRSELTFNFDRLRLRDGRSYQFAGYLTSVRLPNGDTAKVDNEGAVQEDSQSTKTIERTAIGTAIGAIIGAIAGGGKGAAIGAVVGAGGGAGSVYVQGRDDLDLPTGSELTIQVTGPNRQ